MLTKITDDLYVDFADVSLVAYEKIDDHYYIHFRNKKTGIIDAEKGLILIKKLNEYLDLQSKE